MMASLALGLFVAFAVAGAAFLALTLILGNKDYQEEHRERYSLLCDFPFELFEKKSRLSAWARVFFFLYACASLMEAALLLLLQSNASFQFLLGLAILLVAAKGLEIGTMLGLTYVPAYDSKRHLIVFVVFGGASFLDALLCGFTSLNLGKLLPESPALSYGFMIAFFFLALVCGALMLNPKLGHWPELKTEMAEDGSILTKRPRPFVLAFSEWLVILLNLLCQTSMGIEILLFCFQIEGM